MEVKFLSLTNFRVFKRLEIEFDDRLNLMIGDNAQGKTTILEALHFLSLMTSPIASNDRELVSFLALDEEIPFARIQAVVEKQEKNHRIEIRLILNSVKNGILRLKKVVLIDGVQRNLLNSVGFLNSVIFLPQMTRIIEDSPDERRKYIDQTISQVYPEYVRSLSNYLKGIIRRNALLKQLNEKGGDEDQLLYWDKVIAEEGALIFLYRRKSINEIASFADAHHSKLTNGFEKLDIKYFPSFNPSKNAKEFSISRQKIEETRTEIQKKLNSNRREEIARGVTTIGPHRDDIIFQVNHLDMGKFGSRGQIRTAIMSLKFAEKDWLKEKSGEIPVILLDETLAELDQQRRNDLLNSLDNGGQVVLSTADLQLFDMGFVHRCSVCRVEKGNIKKVVF